MSPGVTPPVRRMLQPASVSSCELVGPRRDIAGIAIDYAFLFDMP
jgi:hypothetical protein